MEEYCKVINSGTYFLKEDISLDNGSSVVIPL